MLRQLRLRKGDNVLEIGAGTGYNAAMMQTIVGLRTPNRPVETCWRIKASSTYKSTPGRVSTSSMADGAMGYSPACRHDCIIATVAGYSRRCHANPNRRHSGQPIRVESLQVSVQLFLPSNRRFTYSRTTCSCGFIPLWGIASGLNIT